MLSLFSKAGFIKVCFNSPAMSAPAQCLGHKRVMVFFLLPSRTEVPCSESIYHFANRSQGLSIPHTIFVVSFYLSKSNHPSSGNGVWLHYLINHGAVCLPTANSLGLLACQYVHILLSGIPIFKQKKNRNFPRRSCVQASRSQGGDRKVIFC